MKTETLKQGALKVLMIILTVAYGMMAYEAKAQTGTTNQDKMKPLLGWVGEWKGEGWSIDASRQRTEFTVSENIQPKLEGRILLAEGIGKAKSTGQEGFHAFGVFYYNEQAKTYEVKSWLNDGNMSLSKAEINEQGQFIWGFQVPGGRIRYTITLTDTTWNEKGEFVMESGQAFPIMEMNLTKVK